MKEHLFGTDGIRNRIGTPPLTVYSLAHLGVAIALWAQKNVGTHPRILLGHDTRQSCALVKAALKSGLLLFPLELIDAQVLPTPAVCQLVRTGRYDCGIVVSASHNPYYDNGIKIFTKSGKISDLDEYEISRYFYDQKQPDYTTLGSASFWHEAPSVYKEHILSFFPSQFLAGKKIVLDCAHGAASSIAPEIFATCGAQVIAINNQPTGSNINKDCGSTNIKHLKEEVKYHKADIGFAFDGDADRVIAVSKTGLEKDGDDIVALLLNHPRYQTSTTIVGTVMSNGGLASHLNEKNISFVSASVGDKHVSSAMQMHQALIGGEPSGHIILRDYLPSGDGIFAALSVLESIVHTDNWELETFFRFPQILINMPVQEKKELSDDPIASIIETHKNLLPGGRLLVRYSGTENKLRIMIEDKDELHANHIGTSLERALAKELSI